MHPEHAAGWRQRLGPWIGIGTSPVALMTGGGLAQGLEGARLMLTLAIGVLVLTGLAVVQGIAGQQAGTPLSGLVAQPLGSAGTRFIASAVMALMMLGWFAVNVGAAGTAVGVLAGIPRPLAVVAFALMTLAITWRGIGHLSAAAVVAGVATAALVAWSVVLVRDTPTFGMTSPLTAREPIGMLHGVGLMVGYGAAFALRTPDFTHDLRRRRDVVWCGLVGLAVPLVAFAAVGAGLYAVTGRWDISAVWGDIGSARLGYAIIAVGFVGSVMTNLYSGALASEAIAPIRHHYGLLAVCAMGTVLAVVGFADRLLEYLVVMAVVAPGLVVLCVCAPPAAPVPRWRAPGLGIWAASVAAGLAGLTIGAGAACLCALALATLACASWHGLRGLG